jgi:calcium-dependent protein kinase
MAENEWNVLKKLDHPGIVRLIDIYRDKHNFYLVTEFCEGCELFDEVLKRDFFSERDAAIVLK